MKAFEQTSYKAQVLRLRRLAEEALKRFPINVKNIDFIHHGENTTFKVTDTRNKKYLLRVHRKDYHTEEAINEELRWLESLGKTTDLQVPVPLRSKHDQLIETVDNTGMNGARHTCLFHWIEGQSLFKGITPKHLHLIGQKMALLQRHTENKKVQHRNYWSAEGLVGLTPKFGSILQLQTVTKQQQKFIADQRQEVFKALSNYEKRNSDKMGLIHADMHFGNVLFMNQDMGVIDFDDCGYGSYIYDIVIPIIMTEHMLKAKKDLKRLPEYQDALLEGYSIKMSLNDKDIAMIPYYKKARRLLMLGWMQVRFDNPRIKAHFKKALKNTLEYLRKE